jgi:hypothetical protein
MLGRLMGFMLGFGSRGLGRIGLHRLLPHRHPSNSRHVASFNHVVSLSLFQRRCDRSRFRFPDRDGFLECLDRPPAAAQRRAVATENSQVNQPIVKNVSHDRSERLPAVDMRKVARRRSGGRRDDM